MLLPHLHRRRHHRHLLTTCPCHRPQARRSRQEQPAQRRHPGQWLAPRPVHLVWRSDWDVSEREPCAHGTTQPATRAGLCNDQKGGRTPSHASRVSHHRRVAHNAWAAKKRASQQDAGSRQRKRTGLACLGSRRAVQQPLAGHLQVVGCSLQRVRRLQVPERTLSAPDERPIGPSKGCEHRESTPG